MNSKTRKLRLVDASLWLVLYVAAGAASGQFNVPSLALAPSVWFPAGVSLAAMLLCAPASWASLALIFSLGQIVLSHLGGRDIVASVVLGALAGVGPIVAAWMVRLAGAQLEGIHLIRSVVLAALISSVILGGGGAAYFAIVKHTPFLLPMRHWGAAIFVGICITTPLLIVWAQFRTARSVDRNLADTATGGLAFVGLIGLSLWLFSESLGAFVGVCLLYLPMFCVVIVAIVCGARGGTMAVLSLALICLAQTSHGAGPFASLAVSPSEYLFQAQLYLGVTAILVLTVHALQFERGRALVQAERARVRLELALAGSGLVTYCIDPHTASFEWTGDLERVVGNTASRLSTVDQALALVHPLDRDRLRQYWASEVPAAGALLDPLHFRLADPNREGRWISLTDVGSALPDSDGSVALVAGVWRRVAEQ